MVTCRLRCIFFAVLGMALAAIVALSDDSDDCVPGFAGAGQVAAPSHDRPRPKRGRSFDDPIRLSDARRRLSHAVSGRCSCCRRSKQSQHRNCFVAFRDTEKFERLWSLRKELVSMAKLDADRRAACLKGP